MTRRTDRGTALIAALLVVALMAAVAVELVDAARFATARTANIDRRDQAYWYALGAREFSEGLLARSAGGDVVVMRPEDPWARGARRFPIDGGVLVGEVRDGNNCLNLNAAVRAGPDGALAPDPRTLARLTALLEVLEIETSRIEPFKAQLVDWLDPDARPEPGGAEDGDYLAFDPPHRAANAMLSELDEIRVLPVMTPDFYDRIARFACVRPERVQPALNPNTLDLDEAALLSAWFGGALSLADAEAVLFRRPSSGYDDAAGFWADPAIAALEPSAEDLQEVSLRSRWFEIDVAVRLDGSGFSLESLVELDRGGRLRRHAQRFGPAG